MAISFRSAQVEEAPWFPLLLVQLVCFSAFFGLSALLKELADPLSLAALPGLLAWGAGIITLEHAYAKLRRGLLTDAIIAHAVTNVLIAVQVLLAAHWSLW